MTLKRLTLIFTCLTATLQLGAQDFSFTDSEGDELFDTLFFQTFNLNEDLEDQLIPLEEIISLGEENNPLIKNFDYLAETEYYLHRATKKNWMKTISVFATYSAGNQTLIASDPVTGGENLQSISNGYQIGVNARVTPYDIFGNKEEARSNYAKYEAANFRADNVRLEIRRQIINEYFALITVQKQFFNNLENAETQRTAVKIAELEMRNGRLNMADFSNISGRSAQAIDLAYTSRQNLFASFYSFQELLGVELIYLKR